MGPLRRIKNFFTEQKESAGSLVKGDLLGTLVEQDESVNELGGGKVGQTISGTVGRAAQAGSPWAKYLAQPAINLLLLNPNHCQQIAEAEARAAKESGVNGVP